MGCNGQSRTSDIGHRTSDIGHRTSDIGHRTSDIAGRPQTYLVMLLAFVITLPSHTAHADDIDDGRSALEAGRPCRAARSLRHAIGDGMPVPDGLLEQADSGCRSARRREERRRTEAARQEFEAALGEIEGQVEGAPCDAATALASIDPSASPERWQEVANAAQSACSAVEEAAAEATAAQHREDLLAMAGSGFVYVSAGSVMMGSGMLENGRDPDEYERDVTLTRGFYLATREATQSEWTAAMGGNPSHFADCGDQCPVENVTWFDSLAYANAMSEAEGLPACYTLSSCAGQPGLGMRCGRVEFAGLECTGYRLPTEAEWAMAARYQARSPFVCGRAPECLDEHAWYFENCAGQPEPVGTRSANPLGFFDLFGNVAEWTHDEHQHRPAETTDPFRTGGRLNTVVRGGAWSSEASGLRVSDRLAVEPTRASPSLGVRLARSALQ